MCRPATPPASIFRHAHGRRNPQCRAPDLRNFFCRRRARPAPPGRDRWRRQGIGRALGEHCLSEARRLGYRAMQFNFVISTNQAAVKLWQDLGMKIVATLPGAFQHPEKGYVDVYVMYRWLAQE